jgi:tmRNA-binding protein
VAKGKKIYDKREAIARREVGREIERALKLKRR